MPVIKYFPSSHTLGTNGANFLNPTNMYSDNGIYSTVTSTAKNTSSYIFMESFGINIPTSSIINSVAIEFEYKCSTTSSIQTGSIQAYNGSTAMGSTVTSSATEPTTDTIYSTSATGSWTVDDLNNNFRIYVTNTRGNSTTACTVSYDYVAVTVDYTEPTYNFSGSITDSIGDIGTVTQSKSFTSSLTDSLGDLETIVGVKALNTISYSTTITDSLGDIGVILGLKIIPESYSASITDSLGDIASIFKTKGTLTIQSDLIGDTSSQIALKGSINLITDSLGADANIVYVCVRPEIYFVSITDALGDENVISGNKSIRGPTISVLNGTDQSMSGYKYSSFDLTDTIGIDATILSIGNAFSIEQTIHLQAIYDTKIKLTGITDKTVKLTGIKDNIFKWSVII